MLNIDGSVECSEEIAAEQAVELVLFPRRQEQDRRAMLGIPAHLDAGIGDRHLDGRVVGDFDFGHATCWPELEACGRVVVDASVGRAGIEEKTTLDAIDAHADEMHVPGRLQCEFLAVERFQFGGNPLAGDLENAFGRGASRHRMKLKRLAVMQSRFRLLLSVMDFVAPGVQGQSKEEPVT